MIRGREVALRQLTQGEVEGYVRFLNDPRRCQGQDFSFVSQDRFLAELGRSSFLTSDSGVLAIDASASGLAGVAAWYVANSSLGNLEIRADFFDAALDTVERRREVYRLLCAYLFGSKPLMRLQVLLRPDDEVGLAATASLGFRYEGVLRSLYFHEGAWRDLRVLGVLRGELHD